MVKKFLIAGLALGATTAALMMPMAAVASGKAPGGAGPGAGLGASGSERPGFAAFDADGDGQVTVAEMLAFQAARFAEADSNGDGVISADEFTAAAQARAAERAGKAYSRMLQWRDLDGDGALGPAEMTDGRGEKLFKRVDANHDGVVTADEFAQARERGPRGRGGRPGRPGPRGEQQRGGN